MGLKGHRALEQARAIVLARVLVLQGLVPAAALAHDQQTGSAVLQICTLQGLTLAKVPSRDMHHGFGGLACEQCVMASLAMVAALPTPLPVRVEAARFTYLPVAQRPSSRPRAPPRPPSQGPPLST